MKNELEPHGWNEDAGLQVSLDARESDDEGDSDGAADEGALNVSLDRTSLMEVDADREMGCCRYEDTNEGCASIVLVVLCSLLVRLSILSSELERFE